MTTISEANTIRARELLCPAGGGFSDCAVEIDLPSEVRVTPLAPQALHLHSLLLKLPQHGYLDVFPDGSAQAPFGRFPAIVDPRLLSGHSIAFRAFADHFEVSVTPPTTSSNRSLTTEAASVVEVFQGARFYAVGDGVSVRIPGRIRIGGELEVDLLFPTPVPPGAPGCAPFHSHYMARTLEPRWSSPIEVLEGFDGEIGAFSVVGGAQDGPPVTVYRHDNQDRAGMLSGHLDLSDGLSLNPRSPTFTAGIVGDGMGGELGGARAASCVVREAVRFIASQARFIDREPLPTFAPLSSIVLDRALFTAGVPVEGQVQPTFTVDVDLLFGDGEIALMPMTPAPVHGAYGERLTITIPDQGDLHISDAARFFSLVEKYSDGTVDTAPLRRLLSHRLPAALESCPGMEARSGTTVSIFFAVGSELLIASAGDSPVRHYSKDGALQFETTPHNVASEFGALSDTARMREVERISRSESSLRPGLMTEAIRVNSKGEGEGLSRRNTGQPISRQLEPGDVVLAYSDGLSLVINDEELSSIIAGGGSARDILGAIWATIDARGSDARDNITVVCWRYAPSNK